MGVKLDLFNAVVERLTDKVPELKTIRKWNNQFNNEGVEYAFAYPACFIGFTSMDWRASTAQTALQNMQQQQQNGDIILTIYLGFHDLKEETAAFEDYEPIIQKVWYYLQGWYNDNLHFGALNRIAEREDNNHNNVIVWEIDFHVGGVDCAAVGDLVDAAPVTLTINADLIIDSTTEETIRTSEDFVED